MSQRKVIYYIPGVKVLRPQIVLPNIVASNFVETDTKISSLFMLMVIKYHQGRILKKKHKSCDKKKI